MARDGFSHDTEYEEASANATLAVKTKMDSKIEWWSADTWTMAREQAETQCSETNILEGRDVNNKYSGDFVSENTGLSSIAKIAGLTPEETAQLFDDFYTKSSFSANLKDKIQQAFQQEPEEKVISIFRDIHVAWTIQNSNKFGAKKNAKKGDEPRNKEYQHDDLLLMQYGEDGALADKLFIDSMLSDLGIKPNPEKLELKFYEMQHQFLKDHLIDVDSSGKIDIESLVRYLETHDYIEKCEKLAGHALTTTADAYLNPEDGPVKISELLTGRLEGDFTTDRDQSRAYYDENTPTSGYRWLYRMAQQIANQIHLEKNPFICARHTAKEAQAFGTEVLSLTDLNENIEKYEPSEIYKPTEPNEIYEPDAYGE